jgi:ankyrin repeat protein
MNINILTKDEKIEFLLNNGAHIEKLKDGHTALIEAAQEKLDKSVVKFLLSKGAKFNIETKNHVSSITYILFDTSYESIIEAIKNNNNKVVEFLLSQGANIESTDNDGNTLLHLAASNGSKELVEFLLSKGADIESVNNNGTNILLAAATNKSKDVIEYLLSQSTNIETTDNDGNTLLHLAASHGSKELVEFLLSKGADIESVNNNGTNILLAAATNKSKDVIEYLLSKGLSLDVADNEGNTPLYLAAIHGSQKVLDILVEKRDNPLFKKTINKIELQGINNIILNFHNMKIDQFGAILIYTTEYNQYFKWIDKESEVKRILGLNNIKLLNTNDGKYQVRVYSNSNEAKLIETLQVNSKKPELVEFIEEDFTTYLLFKTMAGTTIYDWHEQKQFIEDTLRIPVDIEVYDHSHKDWGRFGNDYLIIIIESNISVMPDKLELTGQYLKTSYEDGIQIIYFKEVINTNKWINNKDKIIKFISKRVDILIDGNIIKLKEKVEESIPRLLDLKDSKGKYPKLEKIQENGENKIYFYTFIPELGLNEWKNKSRRRNFRILFNEPDKVYKLDTYDRTNTDLYDENFSTKQYIVLYEYAKIPTKEELVSIDITNELKKDNIFWGYGIGSSKYYTKINELSHMMIIGGTGSGKSNFINGVLLSLLHSADKIKKIYLFDLKDGIEFNRYKDLNSSKIDIYSKGTKPSKLLAALQEVEAEMYLRQRYMANNNIVKLDKDPIFLIIDEFAQIEGSGYDSNIKEKILITLNRIGSLARASNIKLIIQTQYPRTIDNELKAHLMSRVLLRTTNEADKLNTLQNQDIIDEQGINHTTFDLGRYIFEDFNSGSTKFNELQFPFINPDLNLHLNYKEVSQTILSEYDSIYDDYKDHVRKEYDYLANTNLLSSNQEILDNTNSEELIFDFDFDNIELDNMDNLNDINYDIDKIDRLDRDSLEILNKIKGEEK